MVDPRALQRPPRQCKQPGCGRITRNENGYCDLHKVENDRRVYEREQQNSDSSYPLYNCEKWRVLRRMLLARNFLCQRVIAGVQCDRMSVILHHLISPRQNADLMYVPKNLVALCTPHHPDSPGTPEWVEGKDFVPTVWEDPKFC
jgi:hypothetical protein